ncbi:cellulose binding domain-containing protein, partial [Streptomyces broussonetiae]|uniref:cellulose binding domain-containing protein n=1 Tax=Streptomyces broussonetiae TaxID=2686304 RepID=UPI0035E3A5B4
MRHPPRSVLLSTVGAGALVPVVSAQGATPACTVEYSVTNQWAGGFQGSVTITNNASALSSWRLAFDFADGQQVTRGWNATWSQSGATVTAANESYNGSLGSGARVTTNFLGSWAGSNAAPTAFTLNGTTCALDGEPPPTPPASPPSSGTAPALHVSGTGLVDASGTAHRLLGVNRSGGEFMCVQGHGIWDGPVDDTAIQAIADWKADAVRIPLNEECWLGLSGIKPEYGGAAYISAVKDLVTRVEAHGLTPVLDLHWSYGQYTG